jgi:hypothetical protein
MAIQFSARIGMFSKDVASPEVGAKAGMLSLLAHEHDNAPYFGWKSIML